VVEDQTAQDVEDLDEALDERPHGDLAPLYGDFENPEDLDDASFEGEHVITVDGGEAIEVEEAEAAGTEASKIDGTDLVLFAETRFDPVVGRAETPPVEYGFDMAENDNVDPIETDGKQDLKDRNRRAVGVIDPTLNDTRREKYPNRTLTGRSKRA
jgi:hypothetical protein